jgi:translation initiation factor IF-3
LEDKVIAKKKELRLNESIDSPEVRLIDQEGNQVGVVSKSEAMTVAAKANLDLVEIQPNVEPPVCKIMDYGRYSFTIKKKTHLNRAQKKQMQVKELKFRVGTEEHDFKFKLNALKKFIKNGDKVKVTIRFRGREMTHQDLGISLMERIASELENEVNIESKPKVEGRQMMMVVGPKKSG